MRSFYAVALTITVALVGGCTTGTAPRPAASPAAPAPNGVADLPAAAVLERARAALAAAKSFRVRGGIFHGAIYNGRGGADDPQLWSVDVRIAGPDSAGWTAIGSSKQESITVGGTHYLRADEQILAQTLGAEKARAARGLLGDRWLRLTGNQRVFGDFVTAAYVDELLKPAGATVTKGAVKVIGGIPTVALIERGRTTTIVYVATVGEPYPVRLERAKLEGLSFTEFGAAFPQIQAPPAADVFGLASKPTRTA